VIRGVHGMIGFFFFWFVDSNLCYSSKQSYSAYFMSW